MRNHDLGAAIPKLGFGLMRVPMIENEINMEELKQMVDLFLKSGFTYFDTAYGYVSGRSESAAGEALVARHPRESFQLATKLPVWEIKEKGDAERVFQTQLERTGAGYFDFYMLHAISGGTLEKLDEMALWDFMKGVKERGLAKHIGFSFHDNAEVLDKILTAHPEVEFVQLQVNYIDWEDENVQSRRMMEVAKKHACPVIIMEPVRGGALATLEGEALKPLTAMHPEDSAASWAMRYCLSMDHVITVLSGMSNLSQLADNIKTAQKNEKLSAAEYDAIESTVAALKAKPSLPCTDCNYCTEKCPQNISIPGIIGLLNNASRYGYNPNMRGGYGFAVGGKGKASACIECGVCEDRCPQHIEIVNALKKAVELFEA